jgi:ParB family chromosome partitioning protein
MPKKNGISMSLPPAADLFSTQEERDEGKRESVREIPLEEISDFPNHPFKVRMDEEMQEMAESVKQYGVLVPALVREKPSGGYEMIAGHRRKMASELAEQSAMPCLVRNLTDDEAIIVMVDSNLQREKILPSEKAFAYKMKLDAMKRQGKRNDLTSEPVAWKLKGKESAEILGKQMGESKDTVRRYIRLTELIPSILEMVDEGQVAMRPAVELSYLPKEQQKILYDTIQSEDCTPSHVQAIKMRKFSEEGKLDEDVIFSVMTEEKPNQVEQFRMPRKRIDRYFPQGTPKEKIEDTIVKALEFYQQNRSRVRKKDNRGER